jgi:hypothetical protein
MSADQRDQDHHAEGHRHYFFSSDCITNFAPTLIRCGKADPFGPALPLIFSLTQARELVAQESNNLF